MAKQKRSLILKRCTDGLDYLFYFKTLISMFPLLAKPVDLHEN